MHLFAAEAGESFLVVDSDGTSATTAAAATTLTTIATVTTTEFATTTTTTASELAAITATATTELATITTVATSTATTTASATAGISGLLLEGVVDVDTFLGVSATIALASSLLFTLEVVLVALLGELLSVFPFLVVLGTLVRSTGLLQTETFERLGGLLGEVVGVRLAVVLRLGLGLLSRGGAISGESGRLAVFVEGLGRITVGSSFLAFLVGNALASTLVSPLARTSLLAPAVSDLLLMITSNVSTASTPSRW